MQINRSSHNLHATKTKMQDRDALTRDSEGRSISPAKSQPIETDRNFGDERQKILLDLSTRKFSF